MKRIGALVVKAAVAVLFAFPICARAQLFVDCSNPSAQYPTINSALPFAGPGSFIAVNGTCNETVFIFGAQNLTMSGAATLNGNLTFYGSQNVFVHDLNVNGNLGVTNSQNVYVLRLNVANSWGDGVDVNSSHAVVFDTCSSKNNGGNGLSANQSSDVSINAIGDFSSNGNDGILAGNNSLVSIGSWAGTTEISNNRNAAVGVYSGNFSTNGNTHIANSGSYAALDMRGAGKAQIGSFFGPNIIEYNPYGAASLQENAEISFWSLPQFSGPNIIRNNGPFGIEAGFGSQVTLVGAQITGHTGPGVDIYGHSQLYGTSQLAGLGSTLIANNGTAGDPLSAGIRIDGNSEALLRGVSFSQNSGPAILALVNSSADFAGGTFTGNLGVISCDSTSTMVSDLSMAANTPASGVSCPVAHRLGNRVPRAPTPAVPDISALKAIHNSYVQRANARK